MSPDVSVRRATVGDVDAVVELNKAMAAEIEGKVLGSTRLRDGVAAVVSSSDKGFHVLAEAEGQAIVVLHLIPEWNPWRNSYFWWIENVYVAPEWRREGVYRAMHAFVHDAARTAPEVCGIRLFAVADNLPARRTY